MSEYKRDQEDQTSGTITYSADAASGNSGSSEMVNGTYAMVSGTIAKDNGMTTYQQNARDNNPKKEIWYAGEKPTTQEIYKRIGDIYTKNPERGKKLAQDYLTLQRDPKSQFYNPYAQATNPAVSVLQSYGVDMNKVTDDYLDNNQKWKQYLRYGDSTNTPKAPTKKSSTDEIIAYHLYQYAKQRDLTRKADTEMEAMRQQIAYLVGRTDLNLSDAQIAEKINQDLQKKYPTLYQMEHSTEAGKTILELNHAIDYSADNLLGMIWAARNGSGSGNAFLDNVNGAMGAGNIWQDNPDIYAKLDRGNSKTFSPYEVGMTANDIGMYFNVNVLDEKALEEIRKRINWDDPTDVSMFDQAVSVVETTKTARDENTKLRERIDKCISDGWSAEDVLRMLDRQMESNECTTLRKMDKSIRTGTDIVLTGEAINFNLEALKQEIRDRCEEKRQTTGVLGIWNNISSAVGQAWNDLTNASAAAVANMEKKEAQAAATAAKPELGSEYDVRGDAAVLVREAVDAGIIEEPKTPEEKSEAMRAVYDDKYGPGSYDRDIETARENSKPYDLRNIDDGSRKDFKNNPALDAVTPNYEGTNAGSGQAPTPKTTIPLLTDDELIAEKKSIRDMAKVAPTITTKGTPAEKAALTTGNTSYYDACVINMRNNIGALATNLTGQAEQKVMTDFYNGYMVTSDYDSHKFRADYWQEYLDNINAELDTLNKKDDIDFDEYNNLVALSERTGDSTWDYYRTRLERGNKNLDQYQQEEYDNALRYVYQNVRPEDYTTDSETIFNRATGWWNLIQGGLVKNLNYRTEADLARMQELTNDKEILESGINEEREYLAAHQDAYDQALKDVSYARNLYMEAVAIAQASGKEIDDELISNIEDICLYINQSNSREPSPTNKYDAAVAAGTNTKAESIAQALTDAVNSETQIEDLTATMAYLEKTGITFTAEQKQNLDEKIAALREQGMIASWSALDSNPDFETVAAEGYKEAKTSNSPIALMVAAADASEFNKSILEYASKTGNYDVNMLTPGYMSAIPESNADSGLRPLDKSWPDQYEYAAAMTQEEKNRFFYLLKKDGIEEAEKYFNTLLAPDTGMVTLRKYGATRQETQEFASQNLLTAGLSTFASFGSKLRILPAELMYGNQTFRDQTEDYRAGSAEAIVNAFGAKDTTFGEVLKKIYNIGVGIADYKISAAMMDSFMGLAGQLFGGIAAAGFMSKIGGVVGETGKGIAKSAMEVLPIVAEDASAKYNSVYKQTKDKNKASQMAALELMSGLVSHTIICQGLHTSYNASPTTVVEGFTGLVNRIITTSGIIGGTTLATSEVEQIVEKAIMGADSTWADTVQKYKNAGYSTTMAEQMADQAMQKMILSKTLDAVGNAALRTTLTYSVGAIKNSKTFQDGKLKMANAWRDIKDYTKAFVKGSQGTIGGEPDFILDENGNVIGRQQEKLTGNVPDNSRVVPTSGTKVMDRVHGKSYNVVGYTYNDADGEVVFITEDNERVRFTDIVGKDGNVTKDSFTESELNLMQNAYNWYQDSIVNAPETSSAEAAPEAEPEPIRPDPTQESTDLSIINAAYGADATAAAIGVSAVLGDADPNVSRAAGQAIVADLANGDPKTVALAMQEIVMNTTNPANVKPDIVSAALVTGDGQQALRKILDKVSRGKHVAKGDIMTLITGVAKDRKNPDYKDKMAAAVRTNRIANKTNKKLTEKKDIIYEADKKVDAAQEKVTNVKESLESAENEVQAAVESVTTAVNDLLSDPANNDNRGPVQRSLAHLDGKDDQLIKQAEQSVTNAEQELAKAQEDRDQKEDDALAEARETAIIETDQEMQAEQQAADEAAAAEAEQAAQAQALSEQKDAEAVAKRTERENVARDYLTKRGYSGDELEENVGIIMKRFDAIERGEVDTSERLTAEDADEFLDVISRRTGITFQTEDLGDPLMNRGYIVNRNNVVLNSNLDKGQALIEAAQHEITHGLEMTGAYDKFADVALKIMYGGKNTPAYERAIEKKIADYGSRGKALTPEDAQYELVAEFSRHNLANKQFINKIVASGIGGQYKKFVAASYEKLKGYKFKGAGRRHVDQLKKAERLLQEAIDERARMVKEGYNGHTGLVQLSITGVTDAVGLSLEVTDNDTAMYKLYKDGQEIKPGEFTPEMVADTKIGKILDLSLSTKKTALDEKLKDGAITQKEYDDQIAVEEKAVKDGQKFVADIVNMIGKYQDAAMVWELAGSLAFTTLKENGDPQYTDSEDMGSVCTKTQAILNVISETQLRLGRGLTKEEIDGAVYEEVGKGVIGPDGKWKHGATPCPPCYVYATWVNKPARLEKARQLREEFKDWTDEQINNLMTAPDPVGRTKTETTALKTEQNQRKLFLECCIAEKKGDTWVKRENPELCPNEVLLDLRRSGDMAVDYPGTWMFMQKGGNALGKAIVPYSDSRVGEFITAKAMGAGAAYKKLLEDARNEGNPDYVPKFLNPFVYKDYLDQQLESGQLTEKKYKEKLQKNEDLAKEYFEKAVNLARIQNLMGGQRWQSWSDFRAEWGSDYLMEMLNMQAIGAQVQTYTKVPEALDLFASAGFEVNMSLMPHGDGFWHNPDGSIMLDEDGNPKLRFSKTTGIDPEAAELYAKKYGPQGNVQPMVVGISDDHIKAALAGDYIGFVIPFHGSGGSVKRLQHLMSLLKEHMEAGSDYTMAQTDSFKDYVEVGSGKNKKKVNTNPNWQLRLAIMTGKYASLSDEDQKKIDNNEFLSKLYEDRYVNENSQAYHVFFTEDQAQQIYPYEYWDTSTTLATADDNSQRFIDYCNLLGVIPRFSGLTKKAERGKFFTPEEVGNHKVIAKDKNGNVIEYEYANFSGATYDKDGNITGYDPVKGYWKLLIDRPMYNRVYDETTGKIIKEKSTYHEPKAVNVSGIKVQAMPKAANNTTGQSEEETSEITDRVVMRLASDSIMNMTLGNTPIENEEENAMVTKKVMYADSDEVQELSGGNLTENEADEIIDALYEDYDNALSRGDMETAQADVNYMAEQSMPASKVRDKDGSLLPMYHGTNAEFTEFDADMIGSTGRFEGSGFNFTPYEGRASSYGKNVFKGYLNIQNPLSAEKKTISVSNLAALIRKADPTGDNIIADYARDTRDYGTDGFVRRESMTAARNIWDSSDNDVDIYSFISAADPDAKSLIQVFSSLGYDGLIHYDDDGNIKTAVAFNPDQFKKSDPVTYDGDNNPIPLSERFRTDHEENWKDTDIRYSTGGELTDADIDQYIDQMAGDLDFDDFMYLLDHGHLPEKKKEEEIVQPEPEPEPEPIDWEKANEEYMAAVDSGDVSTARKLVDAKAKELGYTVYGTHRTNAEFTVFEKNDETGKRGSTLGNGFYVANGTGTEYDNDHYGKRRLLIYANPGKTLDIQNGGLTKRQANKVFDQYFAPFHPGAADHDNPYYHHVIMQLQNGHKVVDYIEEAADKAGTTTDVIFKQLGYNSLKDGPQYCLFDSEQIKLADPITYDDAGNVIPLSERFTSSRYARPNGEMENALYVKDGNLADGNTVDFVGEMLNENGRKKYETRKDGNIKPGWYGLTRGGKGASVEGRVEFGEPIPFRKYEDDGVTPTQIYQDSMIEGTEYDMGPEDTKYAYPVLNREDFRDNPIPVYKNSPRYAKYTPPSEEAERFKDIRYSGNGRLTDAEADMILVESGLISPEMIPYSYTPSNFVIDGKKKYRQFGREKAQQSNAIHGQVKDYLYNHSEYDPDKNEDQIDRAINWIRDKVTDNDPDGYYAALREVLDPNFNYATADGTVRMLAVAGMAAIKAEQGDPRAMQDEQDLYDAFNERATPIAQAMQARKLFEVMTPLGRERALLKEEKKINDDLEKRGKKYRVHIPKEMIDEVVNAKDAKSFRKGKKKIRDELNRQLPVTWGERIIAIRMWSMLSSPKTHLRNIVGNVMMIPTVGTKNKIGAAIELGAQAVGALDKSQRTKTIGWANKEARSFARERAVQLEDVLRGNAKYKEGDLRHQERKVFGTKDDIISKSFGKAFQAWIDAVGKALEWEDWLFLKGHYTRALSGFMTARGLKPEDMKGSVLEEADVYAIKEAQKATYRDESGVADWLNRIGSKKTNADNNKALSVIQWIVNTRFPFKRTPINIAKRGVEYSPVGLGKGLTYDSFLLHQYNEAKKNGKQPPVSAISPTEWIDRFSSGLTGTGILIAGAIAGLFGLSRAGFSKNDPEDQIAKMKGEQEYSIHPTKVVSEMVEGIGKLIDPDFEFELGGEDVSMTLDWAAPRVLPFFTGTALVEYYKEHGLSVGGILDLLMEVTEPMMNMSFMSGVADLFKTDSFSDKPGFWQFIEKTGINFATSLIPTWVGQIASTANGRKTTYKNPESVTGDPDIDKMIQQIGNKLGLVGLGGVPYTNTLGEEPENVLPSWIENIFSPAYFSKVDNSDEMKELADLYLTDPESYKKIVPSDLKHSVKINSKDVPLTGEQFTKLKADRGSIWRDTVHTLVNSPLYKGASDDSKAEMLNIADSYATSIAKHLYDSNYKLDGWVENAYKNGNAADVIIDKVAEKNKEYYVKSQAKSFAEALYTNNRGDISKYAKELQDSHADASTVRKQLTEYFKPLYKKAYEKNNEAGRTEMRNIEFLLTDIDFYLTLDKNMTKFTDKTFEGWVNSKFDEDEDSVDRSWLK